jgi:hypothetical protein
VSGSVRAEDDDQRPEQMQADPDRYFGEAWERSKADVLAERSSQPPDRRSPSTLVPGIVAMSLRGDQADLEQIIAILKAADLELWRADSHGTRSGNRAGFRYFTVKVRDDRDGG